MDLALKGKTALVTGAARGIGAAIAAALAREGCSVFLGDLQLPQAEAMAREIGAGARGLAMDVTDPPQVERAVAMVLADRGRIDVLVNNAGILSRVPVAEATLAEFDAVLRVNLYGTFICTKAVMPAMMQARYGKIINLASISAARGGGVFGNVIYGTAKAGVVALTKGLSRELGRLGINVNAIAPGPVETEMVRAHLTPDLREQFLARVPMGRLASSADVAALALFLASDLSSYLTGETITVDGGLLNG